MNNYQEVYQNIMNNLRNNILNSYGINNSENVNNDVFFGENILSGQNIQLNHGSFQNILQNSLNQKNKYIKVLSDDGKKNIKYIKFKKEKHEETFCSICQDDFIENQIVAILPCNHIFEKESISQWLTEESHKCPVCRYEMEFIEKKDESIDTLLPNTTQGTVDNSNNIINYRNRVSSFLNRMNERMEEREIQRAIVESLKTMNEHKEEIEELHDEELHDEELYDEELYDSET